MKKLLACMLIFIMIFSFVGCNDDLTHSQKVEKAGVLVVGVTERKPMNYKENGEWTGFDTEFAEAFAKEKLGVEVKFVEIKLSDRFELLEKGEIDCVWNGFTETLQDNGLADFSKPYVKNSQVLVMKADRVGNYNDGFQIKDLKFAVADGSAGAFYIIVRHTYPNTQTTASQMEALELVASGRADAAVVDDTLAKTVIGEGKEFPDLDRGFDFSDEFYCVAFQKNSDITQKLNEYIEEIWDGKLIELANKYSLTLQTANN